MVAEQRYTVYAAAVCSNHAHLLVRRHRDDWRLIWHHLADAARSRLQQALDLPDHPVWADRPYAVSKRTVKAVEDCVLYVEGNPEKEGLPRQVYNWVTPYNRWPFHNQLRPLPG